ncbi:MAG: hypothetical protein QG670_221 [Thermoproteota archaeon]|nr:hypothetical protein [Thermoproteota archaeon]
MDSHPDVEIEELERIARKYEETLIARNVSATFWRLSRIGSISKYSKVIVEVMGYNEESISCCITEIFKEYGKPDEIPTPFFGEKRRKKRVFDDVLREHEK